MRGRTVGCAAMLCAALLGCSDSGVVGIRQDTADFDTMRALWDSQNVEDYDIDLGIANEVTMEFTLRFEVRGGVTHRVFDFVGGWRTPTAGEMRLPIDSLFARTAAAKADPDNVTVTFYDNRTGMLTFTSVNDTTILSDAYWYTVKKFTKR